MDNAELDGVLDLTGDDVKAKIAQEIASCTLPELDEDEITIRMYADVHSATYASAACALGRAIAQGKVTRRRVLHQGHECWAYCLINSASEVLGESK